MTERLTDTKIEALKKKAKRYEVRDSVVRGLLLRVGSKGEKIWEVVVQRGQKRQRVRLGTFPATNTKEARRAAEAAKEDVFRPTSSAEIRTVGDLFERYKVAREHSMRSWRMIEGAWRGWAEPRLGHVRISDLTVHHGLDLRDHVAKKVSDIRGSQVIRYVRPMLAWAVDERIISENPWAALKAKAIPQQRDRVLLQKEWQAVWNASFGEPWPMGELARALMLTAQRLNNVAQMRWDEINEGVWTIPAAKMKSTRPDKAKAHEVPLSLEMQSLLRDMPRTGEYIFSMNGTKGVQAGSRQKDRLAKAAGVSDWTYHDLRRTAATRMTQAKVSRFMVARVLGHADSTVTAIYDRSEYRDEKLEALEVLSGTIEKVEIGNVVRIEDGR